MQRPTSSGPRKIGGKIYSIILRAIMISLFCCRHWSHANEGETGALSLRTLDFAPGKSVQTYTLLQRNK